MGIWGHLPLVADWFVARPWFEAGAKVIAPRGTYTGATLALRAVYGPYGVLRIGAHGNQPRRYYLFQTAAQDGCRFIPIQIQAIEPGSKTKPVTTLVHECARRAVADRRELHAAEKQQLRSMLAICGPHAVLHELGELLLREGHIDPKRAKQFGQWGKDVKSR